MFFVFLSLRSFLARVAKASDQTKCLSLNDEPCMIRLTLVVVNLAELKYYLFMIILDKCTGTFNVLSPKNT